MGEQDTDALSLKEASAISQYTSDHLARLLRTEKISGVRRGHSWTVSRKALEEYLTHTRSISPRSPQSPPQGNFNLYKSPVAAFVAGALIVVALQVVDAKSIRLSEVFTEKFDTYRGVIESIEADRTMVALSAETSLALRASIFDPLTSTYNSINKKITSFFADQYIEVVENIVPGYSPYKDVGLTQEQAGQLLSELREQKDEIAFLKEQPATLSILPVPAAPGRVVQVASSVQVQPEKEVLAEVVVRVADPQLLSIETDVSTLQFDLASLTATVNSQNLSFTNSRLKSLESFILSSNQTAAVSTQNNTQIKYIPDNISAISLELNTSSNRIGLLVNQRGTESIATFQDNGTDILTISDGGATTLNTQSSLFDIDTGALDIDATTVNIDGSTSISLGTTADVPFDIDTSTLDIDSSGNITVDTSGTATMAFTTANGNITLDTSTGNNQIQLTSGSGQIDLTTTGTLDLNSATTTIDSSSGFSIDGNYASNLSVTGAALTISTLTSGNLISSLPAVLKKRASSSEPDVISARMYVS